jgi:hypothetical protein
LNVQKILFRWLQDVALGFLEFDSFVNPLNHQTLLNPTLAPVVVALAVIAALSEEPTLSLDRPTIGLIVLESSSSQPTSYESLGWQRQTKATENPTTDMTGPQLQTEKHVQRNLADASKDRYPSIHPIGW